MTKPLPIKENKPCVFCTIPQIRQRAISENEFAFAFLTNIPITDGHTLVSPKRCVATLAELTNNEKIAIFDMANVVMNALRKSHDAEGFNCAWNQERLAGQSVPHFHLHIIPRKEGDTGLLGYDPRSMLYRTGDREATSEEDLLKIRDQIQSEID